METNVTIWIQEEGQDVDVSFTYKGDSALSFYDYVDACKRAALAFGYSENLVKDFFGE
jgi:hypothetical protein